MPYKTFQIDFDSHALKTWLSDIEGKQLPYATALSLTRTAKDAQGDVQKDLPYHFTIRNKHTQGGIRIRRAEKTQWPNCYAYIGSIDSYMVDQAVGGTRLKRKQYMVIPVRPRITPVSKGSEMRNFRRLLKQTKRLPSAPRVKGVNRYEGRPFIKPIGNGARALFVRESHHRLRLEYILTPHNVRINPRDWLQDPVLRTCTAGLQNNFIEAMQRALATARTTIG